LNGNRTKKNKKKSPPHEKFYATAQNTLSFFLQPHENPTQKKNERVFSPMQKQIAIK
jgi:hypothetical protein